MTRMEQIDADQSRLIEESLNKLQSYIEKENYKGWDPYDALSSPLFKFPFFRTNKFIRFASQQVIKRAPINLRPLLRIPKGYNPVTLGLMLQGYCYLIKNEKLKITKDTSPLDLSQGDLLNATEKKIEFLINELDRLQSKGFSGACWGYDFDWEARYANIPAFTPTVVATGFITNALFICYNITGNHKAKELLISSANFVLTDLHRTYSENHHPSSLIHNPFCFSYSPSDKQIVYNASMKGVRILSQVYSITKETRLIETAKNAVEFVIKDQNEDGSWYYSKTDAGKWIDNYHSGYILDCLDEYRKHTDDKSYDENIKCGYEFYINNFFEEGGAPKFYYNRKYPIDCTAAAQSILTLTRFGNEKMAKKVAGYMIKNMQDMQGYYFRDYGSKKEKTSFMRWSNAWMFAALTYLLNSLD